jgi:transcriptional regulator of acetoin/glycerol metabolism
VAELFHGDHPRGHSVCVDASQLGGGTTADVEALVAAHREPTLCIVRNIDRAGTEGVERLDQLFTAIAAASTPASLAAAALHVGMSRSSLCRRIKAYGITV